MNTEEHGRGWTADDADDADEADKGIRDIGVIRGQMDRRGGAGKTIRLEVQNG